MDQLWTPWRMHYILKEKQQPGCVFCAKAATPAEDRENLVVARTTRAMLLLNIYPYSNGHLMAVPYAHVSRLTDLDDEEALDLMQLTRLAEEALQAAMAPQGFNVGINIGKVSGAGLADHLHIHIVPRWAGDTNFMTVIGNTRTIPEMLEDSQAKVMAALADRDLTADPNTGTWWLKT